MLSGESTKWQWRREGLRVRSLHTYHPTMTWSTILLVMRTELDLTVMLLFVKSCLPTSRSCRTSLSCASSSRGAENGIWWKICKEVLNEFYHMQQWKYKYKYKYNHKYKSPAMELRWNAETKDQMCEYFSTFKSQVSRCYLRLMVMSLHKPCYWLTALERLWTVEQILAFSLASCRAHIHGKPLLWRSEIQCTMVLTRRT